MRWTRARGCAAAVIAVLVAASPIPSAASPEDVRQAEDELARSRQLAADAQSRLAAVEEQVSVAVEAYNEANEHLRDVQAQLAAEIVALDAVQRRVDEHETKADDFARRLFRNGAAFELEALLGAGDPADVNARLYFLRSNAQDQLNTVAALKNDRRVHTAQLARLAEVRAEASARERDLAARKHEVEALLAEVNVQLEEVQRQVAVAQANHEAALEEERERLAREQAEREARERAEREARERAEREARARAAAVASGRSGTAPAPTSAPAPAARGSAQAAVDAALSQVGKPYRWGAEGPDAYDCSGLTKWAWAHAGVSLPHSSRMQYQVTSRVPLPQIQPGDLVFFGRPIHHVAIYIGNGDVVEAPFSGSRVRVNSTSLARSDLVGVGRP